jgi:hypothetical protein
MISMVFLKNCFITDHRNQHIDSNPKTNISECIVGVASFFQHNAMIVFIIKQGLVKGDGSIAKCFPSTAYPLNFRILNWKT